jgi:hypothetical protein
MSVSTRTGACSTCGRVPAGSDATPDVRERIVFTAQFGAGITAAVARRQQVSRSGPCAESWRGTVVQRPAGRQAAPPVAGVFFCGPGIVPPQTIIWRPVQTAVGLLRPRNGAMGIADHRLAAGS